ncbi:Protein of unknown function [Gryllus bimaculatus]|nr:Protein of unknown function [Gryllus bimaculatus]
MKIGALVTFLWIMQKLWPASPKSLQV